MDRALSEREQEVLLALIDRGADATEATSVTTADRRRWRAQVGGARVVGHCGCGSCPSIELAIDGHSMPADQVGRGRVVLEASTSGALLLLFVDDDALSYLELAPTEDEGRFPEFPPVDAIDLAAD